MAEHLHHHRQHRPHHISVPPRDSTFISTTSATATAASRPYPYYQYPSTPTPTPSKQRLSSLSLPFKSSSSSSSSKSSLSFLFLLLFSLRSLYSLLPFLRSSPSFSLFPFSFLVSLLSFLLSLVVAIFSTSSPKTPFHLKNPGQRFFSLSAISQSQHKLLLSKSLLLAAVFLLRFQALRYCGTASMILAELSGNVAARFVAEGRKLKFDFPKTGNRLFGFIALFTGLFLLSISWDRIDCFPFSSSFVDKYGFSLFPRENCLRIWPMLLPFLSGFLGCYERVSMNWGTIRQLGRKQVRLISLLWTTVLLFIPAVISLFVFEGDSDGVSVKNLSWPLANTVVFGVLLSETYSDEQLAGSKDFQREFMITFVCTIVLELFYFPELSLWGLLLCGFLLYFAVGELDPIRSNYLELGLQSSEPLSASVMKPIRHILSERKSRKIALFLLINTGYMVVEFAAGFMSNSLGLISDACHMLFDCAALAIGLYASYISRLPANNQYMYGRGRFEVLSGYANAVFLVLVGALIVLESFERILDPQEISTNSLLTVSIGGLLVNVVGLVFFHEEHHHAHGGSGSCSHSHSHSDSHSHSHSHSHSDSHSQCHSHSEPRFHPHSHSHSHFSSHSDSHSHHHHQHSHDHESHKNNHEFISVSSHDCHEDSLTDRQHDHDLHRCDHQSSVDSCIIQSFDCHDGHDHAHNCSHSGHPHQHTDHCNHSHHNASHCHHHHDVQGDFTHAPQPDTKSNLSMGKSDSQQAKLTSSKESQKHHHHHIDHNMEGIFLHVLADTMGSVGVVISTLLIKYKGWLVADPACSIFISVLIISSVIPLLRNSAEILVQRIPRAHEQDLKEAVAHVMKIKGVHGIQNLHVWNLTNTDVVGTLHLHVSGETDKASLKARVSHIFHDAGVKDLTLQIE